MSTRPRRSRLSDLVQKHVSPIHGFGCFAKVSFQTGDYIGTYEGREVTEDGTYVLWLYGVDDSALRAREGNNLLRWLNHCDDPNAEFDAFDLYARRPIWTGEEITIDYWGAEISGSN